MCLSKNSLSPDRPRTIATAARDNRDDEARSGFLEALRLDSSLHQARYGLAELYDHKQKEDHPELRNVCQPSYLAGIEEMR